MAGLTSTGFVSETLETIRAAIDSELQDVFGDSVDLSDGSVLGQLVTIVAERLVTLWELAEAINSSQDPNEATGPSLDSLSFLTGTIRLPATASTTTLTLTGTPTTIVGAASEASTSSTSIDFATSASATIATLAAWAASTAYVVGDRVTNTVGSTAAWEATVAGTSAGSGGPDTTGLSQGDTDVDNTVTWRFLGLGAGAVDVAAVATATGPSVGVAFDITTIETPVSGWDSVINLLDAVVGTNVETDEALRTRRQVELARAGTSTLDAIRADLLQVAAVTAVTVFHNPTDVTDADSVPPHAVEALVLNGADQDIFDKLLASVAAGIATHGTESGTADDSEGTSHAVEFSRPVEKNIWVEITLIKEAATYPSDGDAQVELAIVTFGDAQATGKDAVSSSIGSQAFGVTGVLDVTATKIGLADPPTLETTIAISLRELAVFDTSRITVVTSDGTP